MIDNTAADKKSVVDQLTFGEQTAKRVTWEAWEFTVVGPYQIEVTNASYGHQKDDHSYVVGIDERAGVLIPSECECPADRHSEDDCKHKVALATVGGPVLLNAAAEFDSPPTPSSRQGPREVTTGADLLKTDGGSAVASRKSDTEATTCPNGDPDCDGPDGDGLPCFACYCEQERGETQ